MGRDLKPENILMDENYNVKIADFGFAAPTMGRDGSGYLRTVLGTQAYMAPEIIMKEPYQGHVADLFALGIILFIMYAGHPPFNQAHPADPHYKLIATNRADLFWKYHSNRKPAGFFTDEFKDLMTNMLQLMANQRLSMTDIVGHPWMSGTVATPETVRAEFATRHTIIKAAQDQAAEAKSATNQGQNKTRQGVRRGENTNGKVYMSALNSTEGEESKDDNTMALDSFQPVQRKNTLMYSSADAEYILAQLISKL